jgi:methionine synthase II (cobalamin-independent)
MSEIDDGFNKVQDTEVTVHLSDEVAWDKMMPYFFHFLEGAGYIGVVERMSKLLGGDVYDYKTYFDSRFDGDRNV